MLRRMAHPEAKLIEQAPDGTLLPLPAPCVDTGMGLERIASILQGVDNMYEIDEVYPVIERAEELSGRTYGADHEDDDVPVRVRGHAAQRRHGRRVFAHGGGVSPATVGR